MSKKTQKKKEQQKRKKKRDEEERNRLLEEDKRKYAEIDKLKQRVKELEEELDRKTSTENKENTAINYSNNKTSNDPYPVLKKIVDSLPELDEKSLQSLVELIKKTRFRSKI